jgi:hypothetical protein
MAPIVQLHKLPPAPISNCILHGASWPLSQSTVRKDTRLEPTAVADNTRCATVRARSNRCGRSTCQLDHVPLSFRDTISKLPQNSDSTYVVVVCLLILQIVSIRDIPLQNATNLAHGFYCLYLSRHHRGFVFFISRHRLEDVDMALLASQGHIVCTCPPSVAIL